MTDPAPRVSLDDLLAHRRWVRALALRLSSSASDADDLEQDAWLVAVRSPPREGAPRAWLGTVVRNLARTRFRRDERRERRHLTAGTAAAARAAMPTPDEVAAAAEVQTRLAQAVLALEEPYRATILYRYFEGWEPAEIARRTGAPLETVRTRLRRASAILRDRMRADIEGERGAWGALLLGPSGAASGSPAAGRPPVHDASPTGSAARVAAARGAIMGTAKKCAVAAAVLLLALGAWVVLSPETEAPVPDSGRGVAAGTAASADPRTRPQTPRTRAAAPQAGSEAAAAAPDDPTGATPSEEESGSRVNVRVVADATDAALAGARVMCRSAPNHETWFLTDAEGRVRVPTGSIDGLVLLEVRWPPEVTEWAERTCAVARSPGEATIRVARRAVLRGRVEADGRAPSQVGLLVRRTSGPLGGESKPIQADLGRDGSFAVPVDPGRYLVLTQPSGPRGTLWTHERRTDVDPSGEPLLFRLRAANGYSCVLRNEGVPGDGLLAGAFASPQGGEISFQETADRPAFAAPVPTLRVAPDVLHDVWAKVAKESLGTAVGWGVARAVRPGETVEIAVRPAWDLRVTVVDPGGDIVRERLSCVAWPEGAERDSLSMFGAYAETTAGEALLRGLPPLLATLWVGGPSAAWCSATPPKIQPGTESVVVEVVRTASVRGRLVDRRGRPVAGLVVAEPRWPPSVGRWTSTVRPDGGFRCEGLVPGKTRFRWAVRDVDLTDLGEHDVPARETLQLVVPDP